MSANDHLHPQQLKMFMTAREITSQYQPLDGDRWDTEKETFDSRAGQSTARSHTTGGGSNPRYYHAEGRSRPFFRAETREGVETDAELWDRKYQEASKTPREHYEGIVEFAGSDAARKFFGNQYKETPRRYYRGESMDSSHLTYSAVSRREGSSSSYEERERPEHPDWGRSLRQSVLRDGVQSPVRLGETVGSQGKPEVLGGHHRIAVMRQHRPDDLIPVVHDSDLRSAKQSKNYRYT